MALIPSEHRADQMVAADQAPCGWCCTAARSGAFVCPACGARRGYMAGGGMFDGRRMPTAAVLAPALLAAMVLPASYVLLPLALFGVHRFVRSRLEQPTT